MNQRNDVHTALITGASGGIGLELARLFAADGHNLVLVARSGEALAGIARELEARHGITARVMVRDLAKSETPRQIFDELTADGIHVHTLVNNAGFGSNGPFAEADVQNQLDMIAVNITSLTELTRRFLPGMIKAGQGRILNVGSTAGFFSGPLMAVYYASKAFVLSFTEALANETQGTGVTVSVICPGPTETGFQSRAGVANSKLFSSGVMDAATVARIGYTGMLQGKTVIVTGFRNKFLVQTAKFAPRAMLPGIVRTMNEHRKP
jgi:uncharacterized protein